MKKMNKKGFTLVEIMIVVAIIGLLAAIGIPSFSKARSSSQTKACINNLRIIEGAVSQAAIENDGSVYTEYIKGGADPTCPAGGTYDEGAVGTSPSCDYEAVEGTPAHVLPNQQI